MRTSSRTRRIIATAVAVLVVGTLGWSSLSLKKSRDALAESMAASERKTSLLNEKYKEEKAQVGRLQRSAMTFEGQIRQARMDKEKAEKELAELKSLAEGELKKRIESCEAAREQLKANVAKLTEEMAHLEGKYQETTAALKTAESENKALKGDIQNLKAELKQAGQDNRRYRAHNVKLSEIARELVARVEKNELGTSVLVKDPVLQFQKVELEKMLQEYLDRIDDARAVN
jgi:chromosome segregation ATPase